MLVNDYPADYVVGLDLAQTSDFTALCVLEEPVYIGGEAHAVRRNAPGVGWRSPDELLPAMLHLARRDHLPRPPGKPPLRLRWLERFNGVAYPALVEHVAALIDREPLRSGRVALVIDQTGVGRPVCDLFRHAGLTHAPVTITGGFSVSLAADGYRVPKRDLVAAGQTLLQAGRLEIAKGVPHADTLTTELRLFRVKIDPRTAHDSYAAATREGAHDDLVLALCLAAWWREHSAYYFDRARARVPAAARDAGANGYDVTADDEMQAAVRELNALGREALKGR